MPDQYEPIEQLKVNIIREKRVLTELNSFFGHLKNADDEAERRMISSQFLILKGELKKASSDVTSSAERIFLFKPLKKPVEEEEEEFSYTPEEEEPSPTPKVLSMPKKVRMKPDSLERNILKRMRKKKKQTVVRKEKKPRHFVKMSSDLFHELSIELLNKGRFKALSRDLIKADMEFVPAAYISVVIFSTVLSFFAAILIATFFLFFSLAALPPFVIPMEESLLIRFFKVVWLLVFIPFVTAVFGYYYPSLEKKAIESRINEELPFAVVHMSSISSSMIEPSKIFTIIVSTKEYPFLEKEFIKIQNEINVYGYDLVTSLRNRSFNSPSKKLSELFNGLATTINSGGDLPNFFDKRAQTLLFDHRLEKEKQARASETFMDIYISAVIAAPMILMLILMMMRISGLGLSLSTGMISLIVILGVSFVNILFLGFLHLKNPEVG